MCMRHGMLRYAMLCFAMPNPSLKFPAYKSRNLKLWDFILESLK